MGISNRDYVRDDPPTYGGGGGGFTARRDDWAIRSIIIACVAVFFLQNMGNFGRGVTDWLELHWAGLGGLEIWRVVTYGFCHGGAGHLFFNMLGLWILGRPVEGIYGSRETLAIFLVTVGVSGAIEVGINAIAIEYGGRPVHVIGASGGVLGFIVLAALHYPRMPIQFMFIPFTFELRWLAIGYVGWDVLHVLQNDSGGVARLAHLSGAGFAFVYFHSGLRILSSSPQRRPGRRGGILAQIFRRLKRSSIANPKVRIYEPPSAENLDSEVDRLLDKINREGRESLTPEENETLLKASEKYRNRV